MNMSTHNPASGPPPARLLVLRHGPTRWNVEGRIQGHTDMPLLGKSRSDLAALRLPSGYEDYTWWSSPLRRAVETAQLLSGVCPRTDVRLCEMHWGEWEGRILAELRAALGETRYRRLSEQGLDFRPPGAESPRELQARLCDFLAARAEAGCNLVVVCHKGVLKALLGLVFDWNLVGKSPVKLDWQCAHLFEYEPVGRRLHLAKPNIALHPLGPCPS